MSEVTMQKISDWLEERDHEVLHADGFEDAFIGVVKRCGQETIAIYDYRKCVDILIERDGLSMSDAEEYLEFNAIGTWVGPGTPGFLETF